MNRAAGGGAGMLPLDDPQRALAAWDDALAVPRCAVDVVLLHHGGLVPGDADALDLPVSALAVLLARLWTSSFGGRAECVVRCGACGEDLEVALPVDRLAAVAEPPGTEQVRAGTEPLVVRCPTTRDLVAVAAAVEADPATRPAGALVARCLRTADGRPVDVADLAPDVLAAVESAAERVAGGAAATVTAGCPACEAPVRVDLDPGDLLWQRLRALVPTLLADVADLASAFGWSESDVLALPPGRRSAYLSLFRGES